MQTFTLYYDNALYECEKPGTTFTYNDDKMFVTMSSKCY